MVHGRGPGRYARLVAATRHTSAWAWATGTPAPQATFGAERAHVARSEHVAAALVRSRWHTWTLKEGAKGPMIAEFAFVKVIDSRAGLPGTRQWLILRRGLGAGAETKYYLSNAPFTCSSSEFVRLSGMRWRLEIVFPQMTKTDLLAGGAGGGHKTDLHPLRGGDPPALCEVP